MFTPFAFIKSDTIVTDQLAFYINALNGSTVDTAGGQTGSTIGTISDNGDQYWSGFSNSDYISYNTNTFNNPRDNGVVTFEIWAYYSSSFTGMPKAALGIDRAASQAQDDYALFASTGSGLTPPNAPTAIRTFIPEDTSVAKPDVEFDTLVDVDSKWCHIVTTINGSGSDAVNTYIQPLNDIIYSGSNGSSPPYDDPDGYGPTMYIGRVTNTFTGSFDPFTGGEVGLVRIYNKVLSLKEIEQNYRVEASRFLSY
jgi:hypothetical protein